MKRLILPLFFITIFIFSGCDDLTSLFDDIDDTGTTTSCKIKKMVTSDGETTYDYSKEGLLTRMSNSETWDIAMFYNGNGQISKLEYYNKNTDTLDFYLEYTWINNNKAEEYLYQRTGNNQWEKYSKTEYNLNDDGDIVKVLYYEQFNKNWVVTSYDQYTIENKNVIKAESYVLNDGNFIKQETTTYKYDDKVNPLRNLSIRSIASISQYYWFTKNNLLKIVTTDESSNSVIYTADFEYEYNGDDFPVSYTRIDSTGGYTQTYKVSSIEYDCK